MPIRVLFHDQCFDGATSAALFSAFYRECVDPKASFEYWGVNHGPGDVFHGAFRREVGWQHVCVDFRYSTDPRLTWWFDHHQSAFMSPQDETHFYHAKNPQHFYDPAARSCSKFLAETCAARFGFHASHYAELIHWADVIDGAQFESPKMAVELKEPALRLMTWVEANRNAEAKIRFIQDLQRYSLEEVVHASYVQATLGKLLRDHEQHLAWMRTKMQEREGVVVYDITERDVQAANKFIPYYMYPDCHYVAGLSSPSGRLKISVGANPWHAQRRTVNLASLCAQYGGGGHPVVGAVSFPLDQRARAQQALQEIVQLLQKAARSEK